MHLITLLAALATAATLITPALACTTVLLERDGVEVLGKSYDWSNDRGLVIANPRGLEKRALASSPSDRPATWTARFASLTFNQYGRELPNGGMNEAGLMVEIMWLDESRYPKPDGRPTVNELQWIQYQLDRFATVEEVISHVAELRVAPIYGRVHYLVCDTTGACSGVEFVDGRRVVSDRLTTKVMTNHTLAEARRRRAAHEGWGGERPIPPGSGSHARYVRAAAWARAAPTSRGPLATQAFAALDAVSQGSYSVWNIVYEPETLTVRFRTRASRAEKRVRFGALAAGCDAAPRAIDINTPLSGDVTGRFEVLGDDTNRALVRASLSRLAGVPPGVADAVAAYPATNRCAVR